MLGYISTVRLLLGRGGWGDVDEEFGWRRSNSKPTSFYFDDELWDMKMERNHGQKYISFTWLFTKHRCGSMWWSGIFFATILSGDYSLWYWVPGSRMYVMRITYYDADHRLIVPLGDRGIRRCRSISYPIATMSIRFYSIAVSINIHIYIYDRLSPSSTRCLATVIKKRWCVQRRSVIGEESQIALQLTDRNVLPLPDCNFLFDIPIVICNSLCPTEGLDQISQSRSDVQVGPTAIRSAHDR